MKQNEIELSEAIKHLKNMFEIASIATFSLEHLAEKETETLRIMRNFREADEFIQKIKQSDEVDDESE